MIESLKLDSHLLLIREINKLLKESNLSSLIDSLCQILKRERNYEDVISGFTDGNRKHGILNQKRINGIHCIRHAIDSGRELIVECGELNCKECRYKNSECSSAVLIFDTSAGGMVLCVISKYCFNEVEVEFLKEIIEMIKISVDRINIEESLRKSEETLRGILRASPVGIGIADKRVFRFVNRKFCEITGYSPEELIGKDSRFLYESDEEYERVGRIKYSQIREKGTGTVETRFKRKNGEIIDVLLSSSAIDPTNPFQIIFTAMDITERRKARMKLEESEKKYRTIFENTGTAMAIIEEDMTISMVNSEFERISGYRRGEIEGRKWSEFVHPEDVKWMRKYHYARRKGERVPKKYESRAIDKYGNVRDILITVDVIPGTKRSVISLVDITATKKKNKLLKAISKINEIVARQRNPETTLKAVCDNFKNVYESAFASLFEDKGLVPVAMEGIDSKSVKNSLNSCPSIMDAIKGKTGKMRTDDPSCKNCTMNKHKYVLSVPLIYKKNYGILSIHSSSEFGDEEVELLEKLAVNIAFSLNAYEIESERMRALEQLAKNLQQFDRTADRLRNPLAVLISSLELMDEIGKEKAIDMVREQTLKMKDELDELRREEIATYKLIEKSFKKIK